MAEQKRIHLRKGIMDIELKDRANLLLDELQTFTSLIVDRKYRVIRGSPAKGKFGSLKSALKASFTRMLPHILKIDANYSRSFFLLTEMKQILESLKIDKGESAYLEAEKQLFDVRGLAGAITFVYFESVIHDGDVNELSDNLNKMLNFEDAENDDKKE